jgi:uncharacterized membrane protein YcaP (DUF421 family)
MGKSVFDIDWNALFIPTVAIGEIFLRGSLVYFMLFLFLRFFLNRETAAIGPADLIVLVLIADASQNAMAANYNSITEGTVLVATIIFWNYTLDWLAFHSPLIARFVRPAPLLLVRNGKMIHRNLRKELITKDELFGQLREQGVDKIEEVKKAYMEGDGHISVIRFEDKEQNGNKNKDKIVF